MAPSYAFFFPLRRYTPGGTITALGRWASGKAALLSGWLAKGPSVGALGAFSFGQQIIGHLA
jgi:hypothetical protein